MLKIDILMADQGNFLLQPCLPKTARESKSFLYNQLYNPHIIFSLLIGFMSKKWAHNIYYSKSDSLKSFILD